MHFIHQEMSNLFSKFQGCIIDRTSKIYQNLPIQNMFQHYTIRSLNRVTLVGGLHLSILELIK
ncbi:hypothetical protein BpHYR1_014506 [Brachionus plicatilis]|uniref:Uncharacterized protein n=1 Tax=Brachionus plicatilis TaxID=10195 RepID=A0A3M7QGK6_BRAPC|nr:hypothetical protein BpHYR1_014506 [Brachionus plicatilis]